MFAKIRHVAVMTENWDRMAKFYQTIFGMKKITNGMTDERGEYNTNRGHLSDGVIGLALLQRQPGFRSGFDHFGLEVDMLAKPCLLEHILQALPAPTAARLGRRAQGVHQAGEGGVEEGVPGQRRPGPARQVRQTLQQRRER